MPAAAATRAMFEGPSTATIATSAADDETGCMVQGCTMRVSPVLVFRYI
jgi:hypothetical protein